MNEPVDFESRITAVEVFRSQALVTRRASLDLGGKSGRLVARLTPLPFLLRDDSLRLRLDDAVGVKVVDVHLELLLGEREESLRTQAEQELHLLARERLAVAVQRERAQELVRMIRSLKPAEHDEVDLPEKMAFGERSQLDAWLELADYAAGQLGTHLGTIRKLDRQLEIIDDSIARAYDRLQSESQAQAAALAFLRKAARLVIEIDSACESVDLEISYLVPAARWVPEYELRVEQSRDQAQLVMKALVAQRTGEEWSRVDLAFATADLNRSTELPELESWRIGKAQPAKPSGWRELPDTIGELFAGYDRDLGVLPEPDIPALPELPRSKRLGAQAEDKKEIRMKAREMLRNNIERQARAAPPPPSRPAPAPQASRSEPLDELCDDAEMYDEEECTPEREIDVQEACFDLPMEAPMAPAAKSARRRSAGMLSAIASAVAPGGFAPGAPEEDEYRTTRLEASADALSFANLRMQGPGSERERGQLMAANMIDRVAEQIGRASSGTTGALADISPGTLISLAAAETSALYRVALPAQAVSLEQSSGHFAARYTMESPGFVPSDGQLHALTLLRRDGKVRRIFQCVPRSDTNVYQLAEFANPLGLPLLAGAVRVFCGGDFVVKAPMETTPPAKTIRVNLGVEQGISVARNTSFAETTSGLLGGDTDLRHKIEIDVHNKLSAPARVEVFERMPVSHDDNIEVKLLSSTPSAVAYDQADRGRMIHGGWKFSLDLESGQKKKCTLEYQITIPSKQVLTGGNRRD
ncbi:MAG TPA: DUF4139 domain-containing protein [Myxococcota bacterium]|nr:DUF4139 domain-containing protein [Myxococcota bacterium]